MENIFRRADVLLPNKDCDMTKWAVVACDQFSSQPEYWDKLETDCTGVPSTLHMMLPEAFLETRDQFAEAERIDGTMAEYLASGVLRELKDSFVYLERTLAGGAVRRGLLGTLDLEAYDYAKDSATPVRATEGTIESRLPPRVTIRLGAPLEMPHIMVFIDDEADAVMSALAAKAETKTLPKLYDFDLSAGGGHIRGWQVTGADADAVDASIAALFDPAALREKYGDAAPVVFAMGDGNHSLATAKKCWEQVKTGLSPAEREAHPARFSLVELVNIHDAAITFEPIHRALFGTDPAAFLREAREVFPVERVNENGSHAIRLVTAAGEETLSIAGLSIGELIGAAERFCVNYASQYGGSVDYIHNDETALKMGRQPGQASLLLPKMEKGELFPSVARTGPFPKKSFSIGRAEDKRYYLECRKIK